MWHMRFPAFFKRGCKMEKKAKKGKKEQVQEFYPHTDRPLIRPKVSFLKAGLICAFVLLADFAIAHGILRLMKQFDWYSAVTVGVGLQYFTIFLATFIATICLFSKNIVIFVIRVYQRYAPYSVRANCLFIPNCSEYMILAIKKYGLIKGVKMGFNRFSRCHEPNGGEDYP